MKTGEQATHVLVAVRLPGQKVVDRRELRAEEVELAQRGVHGEALVGGQLLGGEPGAALAAEEVAPRGRPLRLRCNTAMISFLTWMRFDEPPAARDQSA